jgi:hypothetical protein
LATSSHMTSVKASMISLVSHQIASKIILYA